MNRKYVYVYEPKLKIQTVHLVKGDYAISLVTNHKIKLNKKEKKGK